MPKLMNNNMDEGIFHYDDLSLGIIYNLEG